jgi:hypothetical protein
VPVEDDIPRDEREGGPQRQGHPDPGATPHT